MIDIESKIISCREDTNDYRLCLTREEIDEIKNAWNDGYYQGATDMEEAKQIIIDSLLKLVESTRAETIEECADLFSNILPDMTNVCGINCPVKCNWGTEESCKDMCKKWFLEQLKEQR